MDKVSLVLVVVTFFVAGTWVGAWAMRNTYRKHYGRLLAQLQARPPTSPDPQGGAE